MSNTAPSTSSAAAMSRVRPAVRTEPSIAAACAGVTGAALLLGCVLALVGCGAPAVVAADSDVCADPYADTVHIHAAMEPQ